MNDTKFKKLIRHLPVLVAGRPLRSRARYAPFFIVGSGRCGTTLVRAILEAHPDVHIPPETYNLGDAIRAYRRYSRLPWSTLLRVVLTHFEYHRHWESFELDMGTLYRQLVASPPAERNLAAVLEGLYRAHTHAHKPTADRWGDKTPQNANYLTQLRAVFPDLRVVHMIRDGRDVVGSFVRLNQLGLVGASRHWVRHVRAAQAFGAKHPDQYLEVRYERLVSQPRSTIEEVAAFLRLTFDERMLRHHELGLRLGDVERLPHLQGVQQAIHGEAVGRWRTQFSTAEVVDLEVLMGPTLARLGYEVTKHP